MHFYGRSVEEIRINDSFVFFQTVRYDGIMRIREDSCHSHVLLFPPGQLALIIRTRLGGADFLSARVKKGRFPS